MRLRLSRIAQPGYTAIEFILTAIPVLLLSLSAYEVSVWYNTRHSINLALVEAARQGSVHHTRPEAIQRAFEQALHPLFVPHGVYNSVQARQDAYFQSIESQAGYSWQILIESPQQSHFADFKRDDLAIAQQTGLLAIDNNFQKEQDLHRRKGLFSGEDIFQANTLRLSLNYPYKPKVPGLQSLFKQLAIFQSDPHAALLMREAGVLVIKHSMSISMQSHPVYWANTSTNKVRHAQATPTLHSNNSYRSGQSCQGMWCLSHELSAVDSPTGTSPATGESQGSGGHENHSNTNPTPPSPHRDGTSSSPSHPESGATNPSHTPGSNPPSGTNAEPKLPQEPEPPSGEGENAAPPEEELCEVNLCCS